MTVDFDFIPKLWEIVVWKLKSWLIIIEYYLSFKRLTSLVVLALYPLITLTIKLVKFCFSMFLSNLSAFIIATGSLRHMSHIDFPKKISLELKK